MNSRIAGKCTSDNYSDSRLLFKHQSQAQRIAAPAYTNRRVSFTSFFTFIHRRARVRRARPHDTACATRGRASGTDCVPINGLVRYSRSVCGGLNRRSHESTLSLDEAPDAYKHFDNRDDDWTKVILRSGA